MRNYKDNTIVKMTFQFSFAVRNFSEVLRAGKRSVFVDFIHTLKIALKEGEETTYWIESCGFAKRYPKPVSLLNNIVSILKVLQQNYPDNTKMNLHICTLIIEN